jgi:uncharacterized protein YjiS (DUF1127 family)
MWFVANLFEARWRVSALALASYRFQRRFLAAIETLQAWRRRAREREALRRYLHYELQNTPNDFGVDARIEVHKPFWEA